MRLPIYELSITVLKAREEIRKMGLWKRTLVYSAIHFVVDFACAFLLFRCVYGAENWILCLITYNAVAFAGQLPLGILLDYLGKNRLFAALGCLFIAIAGVINFDAVILSAVLGLGNAMFHIGGGRDVLIASEGRDFPLGVFVSPGALGLFFGTAAGKAESLSLLFPLVLLLLSVAAVFLFVPDSRRHSICADPDRQYSSRGRGFAFAAVLSLTVVVILRSYLGTSLSFPWKGQELPGLLLVLAVFLGKALGGFFADILGERLVGVISLVLSGILALAGGTPFFGISSMLLFNMTMPITLGAMGRTLKGRPGLAFGLLTFGLFLGFIPIILGAPVFSFFLGCVASAALLNFALGGNWRGD